MIFKINKKFRRIDSLCIAIYILGLLGVFVYILSNYIIPAITIC